MKKILLMMLGAALIAAPASAQMEGLGSAAQKVDVNKLRAAIAKSDAEIDDAKKSGKAATWLKRGETFMDADGKPVNSLYAGMPENMLKLTFGDAPATEETIGGNTFTVYTYEHFKVYMANGVIEFYVPVTVVDPAALDKAYEAFAKAYELDAKSAKKVGEGMGTIRMRSFEKGSTLYSLEDYRGAAVNFRRAFLASSHPTSPAIDTLAIFYAGMSSAYAGSASGDAADFTASLEDLDKALALGHESEGDIYRLKFIDLYNLGRKEESLEVLKTGLARFPVSENLIDLMMRYYAENEGDPTSLIPMVQEAIAKNPTNPVLYQGLARTYDKLGQLDNAIETIKKAVELAPEDFLSTYLEGFYIIKKGDEMNEAFNKQTFTSRAQSQEALATVNDTFRQALAPLEKAYALDDKEVAVVELLKNLTFRLREEPGMADKNKKYQDLFDTMAAE